MSLLGSLFTRNVLPNVKPSYVCCPYQMWLTNWPGSRRALGAGISVHPSFCGPRSPAASIMPLHASTICHSMTHNLPRNRRKVMVMCPQSESRTCWCLFKAMRGTRLKSKAKTFCYLDGSFEPHMVVLRAWAWFCSQETPLAVLGGPLWCLRSNLSHSLPK